MTKAWKFKRNKGGDAWFGWCMQQVGVMTVNEAGFMAFPPFAMPPGDDRVRKNCQSVVL